MPISALPQSTVRLLGSSVNITNPCDLVKELVDNAIDAKATSIEVTISPNSIDKITVRDDGHGIEVKDFDPLGRRTYTSKLKAFDELRTRAGETLGFRGEALASANSLATLSVTTRTSRDPVASRLQLKFGAGGVEDKRPVSAPVGTTVQATKLFENLPARKQYSLKNNLKAISAIKELLKTYALARPYLRLSFKIPGEPSHSWSYAPNHSSTVHEAVLQIFGKNLASNCTQTSHALGSEGEKTDSDNKLPAHFTLDAFIPRPGFDAQAVKGKGAYISVDFRPISSTRGIFKKITAIFKSHLSRAISARDSSASLTSPFMQLNIRCPPCSYDPNVTPLKDEILFSDEKKLLDSFEALCQEVYQHINVVPDENETPLRDPTSPGTELRGEHQKFPVEPSPLGNEKIEEFVDPSSLDDPEVLGLLDGLPRANPQADPGEATPRQSQEPFQNRHVVSATMRTVKVVNMSRTESGATDENSTVDSVVVQITPAAEAPAPHSRPKIRPKETIKRYFHPERIQDFSIALDETATSGEQPSTLRAEPHGRLPLRPLSDSTLNEIHGQAESGSEASSIDSGVFQRRSSSGGEADVDFPIREGTIDSRRPERTRRYEGTPLDNSPPSHGRIQIDFRSPRPLNDVLGLQTPPSSGASRRERRPNLPFRPPRRTNLPVENSGQIHQSGNGVQADLLRQTRISLRSMANDSNVQQAEAGPSVDHELAAEEGLFHQNQDDVHLSNLSPSRQERHGLHRRRDSSSGNPSGVFRFGSQDQTPPSGFTWNPQPQQSGQYSHLIQTLLMRSPPPIILSNGGSAEVTLSPNKNAQPGPRNNTPTPNLLFQDSNDLGPSYNVVSADDEDPRRYLIKRQRSQAGHGRIRRLTSQRLPLEVTPNAMRLHNISTRRALRMGDVEMCMQGFAPFGCDTIIGNLEGSLYFRDMREARIVETRLRTTVDSWVREGGTKMTVEYTLRSAAKGKGKRQYEP